MTDSEKNQIPCPVCNGVGVVNLIVKDGFLHHTTTETQICNACRGRRYILKPGWEIEYKTHDPEGPEATMLTGIVKHLVKHYESFVYGGFSYPDHRTVEISLNVDRLNVLYRQRFSVQYIEQITRNKPLLEHITTQIIQSIDGTEQR